MTIEQIKLVEPDASGVVTLLLNGVERKFMKEKLLEFLQRKPVNEFKMPKAIKKSIIKRKEEKKFFEKPIKVKGPDMRGKNGMIPIIAIFPDGGEKLFPSASMAAHALCINRSDICKVARGVYQKAKNIKFRYQQAV